MCLDFRINPIFESKSSCMETIDPKDQTNQQETEELLAKSKELKEKAKATIEKLDELKEQAEKLIHPENEE